MKMHTAFRLTTLALLSGFVTSAAFATTTTNTFQVTATVPALCSVSGTELAFGNYNNVSDANGTSTITVNCSATGAYTIGLDDGQNYAHSTHRSMKSGSNYLEYELYNDALKTTRWGNAAGLISDTGTGLDQTFTVYGTLPAGQGLTLGVYSDTIQITVTSVP